MVCSRFSLFCVSFFYFSISSNLSCVIYSTIAQDERIVSLEELTIPVNLKISSIGDRFLLDASGTESTPDRFLISGTNRFLDFVCLVNEMFGNGSFKVMALIFEQLLFPLLKPESPKTQENENCCSKHSWTTINDGC